LDIDQGGSEQAQPFPTPPVNNGSWTLQTPNPLPPGWTQKIATPVPGSHLFTFTWSDPVTASVGSQLCVVNTYQYYYNGAAYIGWFPVLLTVIDPSLEIYDINRQQRVPEPLEGIIDADVGGQVSLRAQSINGSQVSNVVWSLAGSYVGDYQLGATNPTPLPLNLNMNPLTFYWVSGGDNNVSVTATLTKNGISKSHTVSGTYFLQTPMPMETDAATTGINLGRYSADDLQTQLSLGTVLNLPSSAGINFYDQQFIPGFAYIAVSQLIQSNTIIQADPSASSTPDPPINTGTAWWADGCNLLTIDATGHNQNIYFPPPIAAFQTMDAPAKPLDPRARSYAISDSFRSYYMYKLAPGQIGPISYPKTIWVSLGRVDWSYSAIVSKDSSGKWVLTSSSPPPAQIVAKPPVELPSWKHTYLPQLGCPSVP
jgi:hypothetical protein